MKKRFLSLVLSLILASSCLTGCGSLLKPLGTEKEEDAKIESDSEEENDSEEISEKEDKKDDKGFFESLGGSADVYEAYKEFYQDFYDENIDTNITSWDCGGQILLDEDNKPLLALCNVSVFSTPDDFSSDVFIYEYDNKEVKEIAKVTGIRAWDNLIFIDKVNDKNKLYHLDYNGEGIYTSYTLEDDGFKKDNLTPEELKKELTSEVYMTSLYNSFTLDNDDTPVLAGSLFESLLSSLADEDPKSLLELKVAYADFFKDEGIYASSAFKYKKDDCYYYYNSSTNKLYFLGRTDNYSGDILEGVPDKIEDIDVVVRSCFPNDFWGKIYLEDIKSLDYSDNKLTICHNLSENTYVTVEGFTEYEKNNEPSIEDWGGFLSHYEIHFMYIDENYVDGIFVASAAEAEVEKVDISPIVKDLLAEWLISSENVTNDEMKRTTYIVSVNNSDEDFEVTYEGFKHCLDTGLFTSIDTRIQKASIESETDVFIDEMTLYIKDYESFISVLSN